jgi:hypothetical protein
VGGGVPESGNPPTLSGNEGRWFTLTLKIEEFHNRGNHDGVDITAWQRGQVDNKIMLKFVSKLKINK